MGAEDNSKYALTAEERAKIAEQKATKERLDEEDKQKAGSWSQASSKKAGVKEFVAFTWPFLWKGGWDVKITTFFTFVMLLLSRVMTVIHPLILKRVIENITCDPDDNDLEGGACPTTEDTYVWILFYASMKLVAETVNYLREIPFSYVSANAEKYIAKTVHSHMQNQSLSFHLSRETGKVLRMVNKGS